MRKHLKDYFIPHQGNDYTPHSIQKFALGGMAALVLLTFMIANLQSFFLVTSQWMMSAVLPAVIVDMINEERVGQNLGELTRNPVLDKAAQMKANDMAKYEYFAHFSPTGVSPWYFFKKANYNFVNAGENLAIHFFDTKTVVDAWLKSPTHRANIMNGTYTETGIGIAEGEFEGFKTLYVVQFFGTPAQVTVPVKSAPVQVTQAQVVEPLAQTVTASATPTQTLALEESSTPVVPVTTTESAKPIAEPTSDVLAEAVEVTEKVDIIEPTPVPVAVIDTPPSLEEIAEVASTTEEDLTDTEVRLFSSFMATTTGATPATIDPDSTVKADNAPAWYQVLAQPNTVMMIVYVALGLVIFFSLMLSILIEIQKQHPVQIAYSVALLLLMFGLFKLQLIINGSGLLI